MKLSAKLLLSMGVLVLLIVMVGTFGIIQLRTVKQTNTEFVTEWLPSIVALEEANTFLSDLRLMQVQHVFAQDSKEMVYYENLMNETFRNFQDRMKTFEKFPLSPEGASLYRDYQAGLKDFLAGHDKAIALSRQNATEEASALLNGSIRDTYNAISSKLVKLVELRLARGNEVSAEADIMYQNSLYSIIGLVVFSLLLASAITFLIVRSTMRQLGKDPGQLAIVAKRVSNGDYAIDDGSAKIGVYGDIVLMVESLKVNIDKAEQESQRAAEESRNALASMEKAEQAGNEARAKAQSMLSAADRLEEVAQIVSSASSELSAQIEQSERGAAEQAARVTETATAMEEMNSTVIEVARNASAASDVSAQTREKAEQGSVIVRKAVDSIRQVQKESLTLKEDMVTLGEHAKSISRIMGVISDIADQTNLLALNAAIEAARAGEAGRGFAVVADEVRKLAEKTMASTTDVGNAISSIQHSMEKSMNQVDQAVLTIDEATTFAVQSGEALREIVTMADGTADQVQAIATAAEEQSASSEEINRSITMVNSISNETARAMQEAAKAVSDLAAQTHALATLIDDMKRG